MNGARQMLPNPDCKAEGQREARARTSAGNNNDDDDKQGGDMPIWMFKVESNREEIRIETRRRSQPSLRRLITILNKMSKSK